MLKNPDAEQLNKLFELVSGYFSLLAEPQRLRIIYSLCNGERSVNDIVTETGSSQANVSRHLAMLHRAGVLARRKDGTTVYYRIEDDNTLNLCQSVCGQMSLRIEQEAAFSKKVMKKFMAAS